MKNLEKRLWDIKLKIMMEMPLTEQEYCLYMLYGEKANQKVEGRIK